MQSPRPSPQRRRLGVLVAVLLLSAAAYPVVRQQYHRTGPPADADVPAQKRFWRERLAADVSDVSAYLALGILEERTGYATSAVRLLISARALGAPDIVVCGPLGRALAALARDDEAAAELEKAAGLAPDSAEATMNLAGCYVNQGNMRRADEILHRFQEAHPTLPGADQTRVAFAFLECGDTAQARTMAEQAVAVDSSDLTARSIAARCALVQNDLPSARKHLEILLPQATTDAGVHFLYGRILAASGDEKAALSEWETTIHINPAALDAHEQIGLAAMRRKDYGRAARAFDTIAQRAPTGLAAMRASDAWEHTGDRYRAAYWRAVGLGLGGRFAEALTAARLAATAPDPAVARQGLEATAEAYRGLRQKEQYKETMLRLTAGGTVADLLLRARAYEELDDHLKRTETLQAAARIAPPEQQAPILYALARAYNTRGMSDEAEKTLQQAIALAPNDSTPHRELARVLYARRALGDRLTRAIAEWQTTIRLSPEESDDWLQLGIACAARSDFGHAIPYLEHAIDLEPGNGPPYQELGRVYARLGDLANARRYTSLYARYVAFDQNIQTLRSRARRANAVAGDHIAYGDALVRMGATDAAAGEYEQARALSPKDASLRRKLGALYARLRMPDRQNALLAEAVR